MSTREMNKVPKEQKGEEPTESTSGLPVKVSPKVKLVIEESPITQKCKS